MVYFCTRIKADVLYLLILTESPVNTGISLQKINLKKVNKIFGGNKKFATFAPATRESAAERNQGERLSEQRTLKGWHKTN